jgi:hypothetical protein
MLLWLSAVSIDCMNGKMYAFLAGPWDAAGNSWQGTIERL